MVVSHVDVVGAVIELAEVDRIPLLLGTYLVVEDLPRPGKDADHLVDEVQHLRRGLALYRASVDDLLLQVLVGHMVPMAFGDKPYALPVKVDQGDEGAYDYLEAAAPPPEG